MKSLHKMFSLVILSPIKGKHVVGEAKISPTQKISLLMICFIFFIPLLVCDFIGMYNRFMADDYSHAFIAKTYGIWKGTLYWYMHWSGRFSTHFLVTLVTSFGPKVSPYVPVVTLLIWWLFLVGTLAQFCGMSTKNIRSAYSAVIATSILVITFEVTPIIEQSFYWISGMLTLVPPLIFFPMYIGFTRFRFHGPSPLKINSYELCLISIWTFLMGGFNETFAALQVVLLMIMTGGWPIISQNSANRKRTFLLLVAGLFGSVLAMTVMILAPGNRFRQAHFPPPPGFFDLIRISSTSLKIFALYMLSWENLLNILSLLVLAVILGTRALGQKPAGTSLRQKGYILLGIPLLLPVLLLVCFVPAAYGLSNLPPARTFITPIFVFVCVLVFWGYLLGQVCHLMLKINRYLRYMDMIIWGFFFLWAAHSLYITEDILQKLPRFRAYAVSWDTMDQMVREAKSDGETCITIPILQNWAGLEEIGTDPHHWVNRSASDYYGITLVTEPCR